MNILAIDPGFGRVGIAVIRARTSENPAEKLLYSDCFKTDSRLDLHTRISRIGSEVARVIRAYDPKLLGIETLLWNTNQKTAMGVAEARGVIIYEAMKNGLTVCEYTPLQVKTAVAGYGKADKAQVAFMTEKLIAIRKNIRHDDEMDAIAIALTCSASYRAR